jgi:hypothetical protein
MTTTGQLLREMFTHMVIAKNANVIDTYYHPDFLLHRRHHPGPGRIPCRSRPGLSHPDLLRRRV